MQILYSLRLPPDVGSVPLVRGLLRSSMEQMGIERGCVGEVALAVTEACANVVTHARGPGHEYQVQVEFDPDGCSIRVLDAGSGFDPAEIVEAGDFAENGRGMTLMRALVDDLDFMPRGEAPGTMVVLTKKLDFEADSPLRALAEPD